MIKLSALVLGFACFFVTAAEAQQSGTAHRVTTPGVAVGTNGTTYGTPGAAQLQSTPGGTIPMAAGTQDSSTAPTALPNYNNSLMDDDSRSSPRY